MQCNANMFMFCICVHFFTKVHFDRQELSKVPKYLCLCSRCLLLFPPVTDGINTRMCPKQQQQQQHNELVFHLISLLSFFFKAPTALKRGWNSYLILVARHVAFVPHCKAAHSRCFCCSLAATAPHGTGFP